MQPDAPATAGVRFQRAIDAVQDRAASAPGGPLLLGAALAVAVVAGGIAAFVVVWAVLVGFFA